MRNPFIEYHNSDEFGVQVVVPEIDPGRIIHCSRSDIPSYIVDCWEMGCDIKVTASVLPSTIPDKDPWIDEWQWV